MMSQIDKIKEEFKDFWWTPKYLDGTKPTPSEIADWWLAKLDLALKEERKRITGIIRQVGALENDEEVEKLIDIINNC